MKEVDKAFKTIRKEIARLLPAHARARQQSAFVLAIIVALALAGCATGQPARALRIATAERLA